MGQTIAEKIIARAAGKEAVVPGEYVVLKNIVGPIVYSWKGFSGTKHLESLSSAVGVKKAAKPEKCIINGDHLQPPLSIDEVLQSKAVRKQAEEMGIKKVYDHGEGIGHMVNIEKGDILPGTAFVSFDPQASFAGGIGAFYTGGGRFGSHFIEAYALGEITICVPGTIKVEINGSLHRNITSRDIWFKVFADLGPSAAYGMIFEFSGSTIDKMDMEQRMVLCGNTAFAGSDGAIIQSDEATQKWFKDWLDMDVDIVKSDADASYSKVYKYQAEDFVSMVTYPPDMFTAKPASEFRNVKISQCVIGTCAGGTLNDLRIAASILKGQKIHKDIRYIVSPITQRVFVQASNEGLLSVLAEAGAQIITPTCDICMGAIAPLAPGDVSLSQQTLNVPGRSGSHEADIYLASSATIAASAITGYITDPNIFENGSH